MKKTHKTAQGLASLGRGPDKVLVHMSPKELHGLQSLAAMHGTSLTVNPKTGLPEAGVLNSILPMLAGAAVTYFSGGTLGPVAMAALQAGAGAATNAAVTGNTDLGTLASGALGGYGGGALAGGLAGAGAATANQGLTEGAAQAAQQAAQQGALQGGAQGAAQAGAGLEAASPITQNAIQSALPAAQQSVAATGAPAGVGQATYGQQMAEGAKGLGSMQGWSNLGDNMTSSGKMAAGIGALGALSAAGESGNGGYKKDKPTWYMYGDANTPGFDYRTQRYGPVTTTRDPKEIRNYLVSQSQMYPPTTPMPMAEGGEVSLQDYYGSMASGQNVPNQLPSYSADAQNAYLSSLTSLLHTPSGPAPQVPAQATIPATPDTATAAAATSGKNNKFFTPKNWTSQPKDPNARYAPQQNFTYNPVTGSYTPTTDVYRAVGQTRSGGMAGGGLASLNAFSGGGRFLQGPGDGVSDSILAQIDGKQPAALGKGEFVIPARHVSELGNGSSEAGAQRLYAMMRRIEAKRKSTDFGADSKAYKELPA